MSKILGISAFYHDSAACILIDGKIIAAAQRTAGDVGLDALAQNAQRTVNAEGAMGAQLTDPGANEHRRLLKEYIRLNNKVVTSSGEEQVRDLKKLIEDLKKLQTKINTLLQRTGIHRKRRVKINDILRECLSLIGNLTTQKIEAEEQLTGVGKFHAQTDFSAETGVADAGVAAVAGQPQPPSCRRAWTT